MFVESKSLTYLRKYHDKHKPFSTDNPMHHLPLIIMVVNSLRPLYSLSNMRSITSDDLISHCLIHLSKVIKQNRISSSHKFIKGFIYTTLWGICLTYMKQYGFIMRYSAVTSFKAIENENQIIFLDKQVQLRADEKYKTHDNTMELLTAHQNSKGDLGKNDFIDSNDLQQLFNKFYTLFTDKEKKIFDMRYRMGLRYQDIAEVMGVSRERVRQLTVIIEAKCKRYIKREGYKYV